MDRREPSPRTHSEHANETLADEGLPGPTHEHLRRGDALGRYVVLDRLGAGAMGLVYAAYDPKLDRRIALKLLHVSLARDPGRRRALRLEREAQAMAKLTHPNVVTVHDVGTHEGRVFVAMEHVEGQTLRSWLEGPRTWSEVLEVFLAAGRGLAAAHDKGLVHRDFKPDNVMIDRDGRVLVMDFGLARTDDASDGFDLESEDHSSRTPSAFSSRITQTGAKMGTPAYMAPEQHLGRPVDGRSDQFAFCVALYEGLFGQRPFRGETLAAVGMAIVDGKPAEPPSDRPVPRWLHQALLRGLAKDPAERHPDMHALLLALQPAPRRRSRLGWAAGGLLLVGGGVWAGSRGSGQTACRGAADHLRGVWDDASRQRVAEAMEATKSPVARETLERVTERLDRYTSEWVAMRTSNCEATRVRGEQSEALLDLRNACLDRRLREVGDVVDVLSRADAEVVERAVTAVAQLGSLDACADVVALQRGLPPPDDPRTATEVEALRQRLAQIRVLAGAGRFDEGRALAAELRVKALELGYAPALAEAYVTEGELLSAAGESRPAAQALEEAYFLALRQGHDEVAARASARLTYEVGYRLARIEPGLAWGEHALALGLRVGEGDLPEADAHHSYGVLADANGDSELASLHYDRAYELRAARLPPDHPDLARSLNALGNVHLDRGEYEDALLDYRASLALREQVFGPHHPEVAAALNNVSLVLRHLGDHEGAIAALRRGLAIYEAVHGANHADAAQARNNLGIALREAGDPRAAELEHRRALEIRERVLGPEHPDLGDCWLGIGNALSAQGLHEAAIEPGQRALARYEQAFGPTHPAVADALLALGTARLGLHDPATAVPLLERAVAIYDERAMPTDERSDAARRLDEARRQLSAAPAVAPPAPPPR